MLFSAICFTALAAADVTTIYRAAIGQSFQYGNVCECPSSIVSVPQNPPQNAVGNPKSGIDPGTNSGSTSSGNINRLPLGSSVISSSVNNGNQVVVYAVPGISVEVSLSVGVTVIRGTTTTTTQTVTTTATTTATTTRTAAPTGTGIVAPVNTASGTGIVAPGSTALATTNAPFLNATSSLVSRSTIPSMSNSLSSSVAVSSITLPASTSSTTPVLSSSSSASPSSSLDILGALRAASATQFCSSFLGYMQTTTTESAAATSVSVVTQTFTSTFSSTVGGTVLVSTATDTSTVTLTLTSASISTTTFTSTSSSLLISSTTTTYLQKRQAPGIDLGGAGPAAISSACSQLVIAPTASTETLTATLTTTSTGSTGAVETILSTSSGTISTTTTETVTTSTTTTTSFSSTTTTGTTTTTTSIRAAATRLGQIGTDGDNLQPPGFPSSLLQQSSAANSPSYIVPADGKIIAARVFDAASQGGGAVLFQMWRPSPGNTQGSTTNTFTLIYQSDGLGLTNSRTPLSFVLPNPIPVLKGDTIGLYSTINSNTIYNTRNVGDRLAVTFAQIPTATGTSSTFFAVPMFRLNVDAEFIAN